MPDSRGATPHEQPRLRIASVTVDLEERRTPGTPSRLMANATRVLDFLDAHELRATIFVVGGVAREHPALLARIAASGHEIGFHSESHEFLRELGPDEVIASGKEWRARLEDLTGSPVLGYRAPSFSLTRAVPWAPAAIADAGFAYSSSVVPARNPVAGFPGAPTTPFRWPEGLPEFPCPVGRLGPVSLPFAGGVYLRVLPMTLIRTFVARQPPAAVPWIYCHPYDFDAAEPFRRMPGTRWWETPILFFNRKRMFERIAMLVEGASPRPLSVWGCDPAFVEALPVFAPSAPRRALPGALGASGVFQSAATPPDDPLREPPRTVPHAPPGDEPELLGGD